MGLIGMGEAARRIGVRPNSARRSLQNAGVPLVEISSRSYAVDEEAFEAFVKARCGNFARGGRRRKQTESPSAPLSVNTGTP